MVPLTKISLLRPDAFVPKSVLKDPFSASVWSEGETFRWNLPNMRTQVQMVRIVSASTLVLLVNGKERPVPYST